MFILCFQESSVSSILDGVLKRVESQVLTDNGMNVLLSIIMKIIDRSSFLENVLAQVGEGQSAFISSSFFLHVYG